MWYICLVHLFVGWCAIYANEAKFNYLQKKTTSYQIYNFMQLKIWNFTRILKPQTGQNKNLSRYSPDTERPYLFIHLSTVRVDPK